MMENTLNYTLPTDVSFEHAALTCFKAYDMRGKLGGELNENITYRV